MCSSKARGACGRALSAPHSPQKIVSRGGNVVRTLPTSFCFLIPHPEKLASRRRRLYAIAALINSDVGGSRLNRTRRLITAHLRCPFKHRRKNENNSDPFSSHTNTRL